MIGLTHSALPWPAEVACQTRRRRLWEVWGLARALQLMSRAPPFAGSWHPRVKDKADLILGPSQLSTMDPAEMPRLAGSQPRLIKVLCPQTRTVQISPFIIISAACES